ncbi:MAG: hypothetical protein ACM3XO_26285 [Bacteroidota bacterium]
MDTNIIVAVITLIGTVAVAVISNLDKFTAVKPTPPSGTSAVPTEMQSAPTAVVFTPTTLPTVVPTDTVPAGNPTSTPLPPTDTPPATVAPVPLGADWPQGCISTLWQPYPVVETVPLGNGCWQQPIYFFETANGSLDFQDDGRNSVSNVYGLFAPLPGKDGSVTVKVSLRELNKADLLIGVYPKQDLNSDGLLMAIPAGNVNKEKILQMMSYNNYKTVDNTAPIDQRDGFTITFTYTGTSVTASVPGVYEFKKVTVPGSPKYIFLGYRKLGPAYTADGTFISLNVNQ